MVILPICFSISIYLVLFYILYTNKLVACDCPCDDLVDVETPTMAFMELSYIAQAIVVTIVGFNMAFKYAQISHERGGGGGGGGITGCC